MLEVAYFDRGAGVIRPSVLADDTGHGSYRGPSRQASYTRLNTERERRAYFEFAAPMFTLGDTRHPHLRITGLQYLKSLRLHTAFTEEQWKATEASVPADVTPLVSLRRPMDLVTTAGIGVRGDASSLSSDLSNIREFAPLAKVLGFSAIEVYVRWNLLEPVKEGEFDFSYYDAIVAEITRHGLKWFPLLIVGSAYALPDWFIDGPESVGFVCLEHGMPNLIQSIWNPAHRRHVERVLKAFGEHYDGTGTLRGVRLGPSGNYGESQYPAGGNWPARGRSMHIHIGHWGGDDFARADFQETMRRKYGTIAALNAAWDAEYSEFGVIRPVLPITIVSKRQRIDQAQWYTDSMSDWCAWWARTARDAMPNTKLYQSAGGWGFHEAGTDYSAQTKAMASLGGGIRLTNETDSYEQNFYATALAATAARLYGADLGFEPASSHTGRGVAARIFHTASRNGDHLFTYQGNVFNDGFAIDQWLRLLPVLDMRQDPVIDVAVYYPETMNQLDDAAFRHLYAWGFNPRAREVRRVVDVDYLDERLIREGFLERYKVLVFVWGDTIEADVQRIIDAWLQTGGVIIYPSFPRGDQTTVEGDATVFRNWSRGLTGAGAFYRHPGDMEPPSLYGDFVKKTLLGLSTLHPYTQEALRAERSDHVFFTVQEDGHLLILNYGDSPAVVRFDSGTEHIVGPYDIARLALKQGR